MIPIVRINGEDFIGTEYEDVVWSKIQSAKKACAREFMICFHGSSSKSLKEIALSADKHADSLQLKTTVKLWDKAKSESVFLDSFTPADIDHIRRYRFACNAPAPTNVIMSMNFIIDHFRFMRSKHDEKITSSKKQKRNDSIDFDYNK